MSQFTKGVLAVIALWLIYQMGHVDGWNDALEHRRQQQAWIEPEYPQE